MCGIAGCSLSMDDTIDAHALSTAMLLDIESRGRDATGAAWFDGDGTLWTQKDHMRATDWVPFSAVPAEARTVILHTRYATQGSHWDNANNHPLVVKDENDRGVVGVHNGMIWNDDRLYTRMDVEDRRTAEVDSEAIFAAIAFGCEKVDGRPRLAKTLEGVLEEIGGSAAIGWLDLGGDPHTLHVARISQSPQHFAFTKKGSFLFASEKATLTTAARKCNLDLDEVFAAPEGSYMRVRAGSIVDRRTYEPWENQRTVYGYGGSHYMSKAIGTVATAAKTQSTAVEVATPSLDELGEDDEYSRVEGNLHKTYKYRDGKWELANVVRLSATERLALTVAAGTAADLDVIDAEVVEEDDDDPFAGGRATPLAASDPDVPEEERMTESDPTFKPYFSGGALHSHVVHLMFNDVDYVDGSEAAVEYPDRELAIENIATQMTDDGVERVGGKLYEAGAFLRQGDLVVTDLGQQHNLGGTIVGLPPEFPEGEYLIKLMVPNTRYRGDFEPVIVTRRLDEFMLDNPTELVI